jgi:hypothetical protein
MRDPLHQLGLDALQPLSSTPFLSTVPIKVVNLQLESTEAYADFVSFCTEAEQDELGRLGSSVMLQGLVSLAEDTPPAHIAALEHVIQHSVKGIDAAIEELHALHQEEHALDMEIRELQKVQNEE